MAFVHREFSQANPESQPAQVVPILYTAWSFTLPSSTKLQTTMDILLSSFSSYQVTFLMLDAAGMPSETRDPVAINRRCSLIFSTSLSLLALLRIRLMMLHLRFGVE